MVSGIENYPNACMSCCSDDLALLLPHQDFWSLQSENISVHPSISHHNGNWSTETFPYFSIFHLPPRSRALQTIHMHTHTYVCTYTLVPQEGLPGVGLSFNTPQIAKSLFKRLIFIIECLYDQQDPYQCSKATWKTAERKCAVAKVPFFSLLRPPSSTTISQKWFKYSPQNWCLSQCRALQPLSVFITTNSPWSIKLFSALPGCCALLRTPFSTQQNRESDLVRFWYRSVYILIQVRSNKMQHNFLVIVWFKTMQRYFPMAKGAICAHAL